MLTLAGSAVVAFLLPHSPSGLRALLLGAGPVAPLIALAAWIVLTPAMFPGHVLAAACGLAFGAFTGSLLAVGGAVAGGLIAFALARTAARNRSSASCNASRGSPAARHYSSSVGSRPSSQRA